MNYLDLPYKEKRKILRQFYHSDSNAHELVQSVVHDCYNKLIEKDVLIEDIKNKLNSFLVDGYMAYEKMYNVDKLLPIDPVTIRVNVNDDSEFVSWTQNEDVEIPYDKVIYMMYDESMGQMTATSFVEQIYRGVITKENEKMIEIVKENIVNYFEEKLFHNVNSNEDYYEEYEKN